MSDGFSPRTSCSRITRTVSSVQVADKVKMLFAGIAQAGMPGGIRAYPIGEGAPPGSGQGAGGAGAGGAGVSGGGVGGGLSGEFQEYGCLSLAVSCMVLNHDGSLLFVGGEDGVLAMYCVADGRRAAEKKVCELLHTLICTPVSFVSLM